MLTKFPELSIYIVYKYVNIYTSVFQEDREMSEFAWKSLSPNQA